MPPLDHPAFRSTGGVPPSAFPSQTPSHRLQERHQRSSSSLPSMHSTSRRKRFRGVMGDRAKAQDIFGSLSRPPSARRRASAEFSSSQTASTVLGRGWETNASPVFLTLGASGGSERDDKLVTANEASGPDDLRDFKFDTRAKRVVCPSNLIFSLHLDSSLTLFVLFVGGVVRHAARGTFFMAWYVC